MHWGHATSTDLITWQEQPIALYPDKLGLIFSGSAVVDTHNTSGFGKDGVSPVIAMYTYHNMDGEKAGTIDFQTQAIAYSLDEGHTWTKYDKNPVISNPGIKDFRDPKVIWDTNTNQWIMVLAAADKILFYSSKDLKKWQLESEFGKEIWAARRRLGVSRFISY
jgi:Beta-fructosidases (levanase/invertase)